MLMGQARVFQASIMPGVVMALLLAGCARLPQTTRTGDIQYIHIRDQVAPQDLHVGAGDEVRWINERDTPVRLGFLENTQLDDVSCEKGFWYLGAVQDMVTIAPHDYVSLCFSRTGRVRYNVWWDQEDPRNAVSRTATIHISMGRLKNRGAG